MRQAGKQWGGTFLGFIVGVVVGLGAALAVAVYVTKVPVPFINRPAGSSVEKEAAESEKNRNWDPNAPLHGKNPARPVPAASAASAAVGGTLPPAVAGRPATEPPASGKPVAKPSADPLGDLVKARTATAPADPFSYFLQAGAFRSADDAEAQRAKLSLMGLEAKVTERDQAGRTVYRVRLGPFDRRDDAEGAKARLDALNIESALVRVQR